MSLILRKACQEHLDNAGLDKLHVSINGDKRLAIVGECGQQLVTVKGIEFNNRAPSKAVIEYAVELFQKFLDKYADRLKTAIKAKEEFSKFPKPVSVGDRPTELSDNCYKMYGDERITYADDSTIRIPGYNNSLELIKAIANDTKFHKQVSKYFREFKVYKAKEREVNHMMQDLVSCDI